MGLYKKIGVYTLVGATSLGLFGCKMGGYEKEKNRQPVQQPSPIELKTTEKSPYTFEKSTIQDALNVSYGIELHQ